MLSLLLELFISVALCGVFVFFAFLNAPAEAGAGNDEEDDDDEAAAHLSDDVDGAAAFGSALLPTRDLPLYTLLARYVDVTEQTTCGGVYRWLLINALHYSPREVYSAEWRRQSWAEHGGSDEEGSEYAAYQTKATSAGGMRSGSGLRSATPGSVGAESGALVAELRGSTPSPSASPLPAGSSALRSRSSGGRNVAPRRMRRRHRRGGPPALAAAPTPLRYESAHWVNVVLRWAAFLCLGGGTVKPEVWTDHLLYSTEKVLNSVNAAYADKMHARAVLTRAVASELLHPSNSSVVGGHPAGSFAPFSRQHHSAAAAPPSAMSAALGTAKALVRVRQLELGVGLLGGPPREVRRPRLPNTNNNNNNTVVAGVGESHGRVPSAMEAAAMDARAGRGASLRLSPSRSPAMRAESRQRVDGVGSAIPAAHSPAPAAAAAASSSSPNSAIAAAGVLLTSSMAGISSVLADVVSSVTTGGAGAAERANSASSAAAAGSGGEGDYASLSAATTPPPLLHSVGAPLGVVLPRVEGDVVSVELPYTAESAAGGPASSASPSPSPLPLRCFAVPLLYEDQRFHLRLSCCVPLGALLPVSLCVPPDVLTLDCAVAVRRVIFYGHLYAAFHGASVELSFPVAPQFTAVVEVMPDHANGSGAAREVHSHSGAFAASHSAAAQQSGPRPFGQVFTAVNTTRNERTNVHDVGRESSPAARPPLPPLSAAAVAAASRQGGVPYGSQAFFPPPPPPSTPLSATTGTSSINERNEKVQEVVLLAVRRMIQSLTYPNVLAGRLTCRGEGEGESGSGKFRMKWRRGTASLPLHM